MYILASHYGRKMYPKRFRINDRSDQTLQVLPQNGEVSFKIIYNANGVECCIRSRCSILCPLITTSNSSRGQEFGVEVVHMFGGCRRTNY